MTATLWALAVLLPLGLAVLLTVTRPRGGAVGEGGAVRGDSSVRLRGLHRWSVRFAQLSLLPSLALTLVLPGEAGTVARIEVPWLMLGTGLALDPAGRSLLLVGIVVYGAALTAVSWRYTERAAQLEAFLLFSYVGTLGVYAATDAMTFYLGFAVMSFSAAGLVLHEGTPMAHRAGRVYLVLTILSEVALLGALVLTASAGGVRLADAPEAVAQSPHTGLVVALLVVGFGVKVGLMPLHVWLPLAHPAAPPAASAVLSGVMVKAGLIGWIRFLPLEESALPGWGLTLVLLALLGAFAAVLLGVGQRDPKVVLAYSTISQMGYLSAMIGVALAEPGLAPAAVASCVGYAVHHGLAKGALFLGVPVWKHHGHGRTRWLVVAGLVVAGLTVAGAPFTSGSLGKYATKYAVEGVTMLGVDLFYLLPLVATGSTILLARFTWLLLHGEHEPLPARSDPELPAWLVIVVLSMVLPWWVTATWLPVTDVPGLDPVTLWDATWPILLGLVPVAIVWWRAAAGRRDRLWERAEQVPAGDVLVLEERVLERVGAVGRRVGAPLVAAHESILRGARATRDAWAERLSGPLDRAASALGSFRGSGVVLLIVLVLLVIVQEVWS